MGTTLYMLKTTCPNCDAEPMEPFYELRNVPVHSVLLMQTRERALTYPKGDIVLGYCRECGFIGNLAFNPALHEYSQHCEETQGFSPTFNAFHERLAKHLTQRYDLHNKTVIEIGCGKGEFLTLLCELGNNRGIGFDPAYVDERNTSAAKDRITFIQDFYSERYAEYKGDFICCKMTLEHIHSPKKFLSAVRASVGNRNRTIVFFQVPDVMRILEHCAFEDIYYEHCSYFSQGSLARLFRSTGFEVIDVRKDYDNQYLMVEARTASGRQSPAAVEENDLSALEKGRTHFTQQYRTKYAQWKKLLQESREQGRRAVIWGSGSKGVAFLTTLDITDEIGYAVDINPYRQGCFMAGTGHKIIAPDFLKVYRPDIVVIMNAIYRTEVQNKLMSLDLHPEIMTIGDTL